MSEVKERKFHVYNTVGKTRVTVNSKATTWSELQADLRKQSVTVANMKCILAENKAVLEHPDATLPPGDQKLYIYPTKTKSGADYTAPTKKELKEYKFKDVKAKVKEAFAHNKEKAAAHFGNYTRLDTETLRGLIGTYKKPKVAAEPAAKATAAKKETTTAVAKTKTTAKKAAPTKEETAKAKATKGKAKDNGAGAVVGAVGAAKAKTAEPETKTDKSVEVFVDEKELERESQEIAKHLSGIRTY